MTRTRESSTITFWDAHVEKVGKLDVLPISSDGLMRLYQATTGCPYLILAEGVVEVRQAQPVLCDVEAKGQEHEPRPAHRARFEACRRVRAGALCSVFLL